MHSNDSILGNSEEERQYNAYMYMIVNNESVICLIIHDCLRILKYLCKTQPQQSLYLGVDNLYLKDGRVCYSDPFLSRQNLLKELTLVTGDKLK